MADATIASVVGREALDSRGNPTVEAEVTLSDGSVGLALVPSGASTGSYEALELRDGDRSRFGGSGTLTAVANVNDRIGPALMGASPFDQPGVDRLLNELDGTDDKSGLGANAVLAVSMATARAAAVSAAGGSLWRHLAGDGQVSLPVPLLNILNGGRHASNSADVQEFMVAPVGFDRFSDALRAGVEIYQALKSILRSGGHNLNVGDEGGFAPTLPSNRDAIEVVLQAIEAAGYRPGEQVHIALDVAASELWDADASNYHLEREGLSLDAGELVDLYARWCDEYPIISIEDGLFEDDWAGWSTMTQRLGDSVQLVGDDLLVTNIGRLQRGIDDRAGNAILLKPNQIGTLSETAAALDMARDAGWTAVMSHRSGETEDTTIADLAVAWNVGQIKTGAPARSERVAKYNRLLRIEAELGNAARYSGKEVYGRLGSR
ncbi:Enolase [Geodia barretti]|uniref:Enolase n=2 Tax=Geodia barretti TaxID=519541 RepID=A0AA35RUW9_GEOBA|nr:Enolase [Geodia barretti]